MFNLSRFVIFVALMGPSCVFAACEQSMAGYHLGIGALVRTSEDRPFLGMSPYAGAQHRTLVYKMAQTVPIERMLWLGELNYRIQGDRIRIRRANETSSFYKFAKAAGLKIEIQGRSIVVENNVENLPPYYREDGFEGIHFDEANKRLAKELESIKGNIRHTVGNSIQLLVSLRSAMSNQRKSNAEKTKYIREIQARRLGDVALVNWLIQHLHQDGRLALEDFPQMLLMRDLLLNSSSTAEDMANLVSYSALESESVILGKLASPNVEQMPHQIFWQGGE